MAIRLLLLVSVFFVNCVSSTEVSFALVEQKGFLQIVQPNAPKPWRRIILFPTDEASIGSAGDVPEASVSANAVVTRSWFRELTQLNASEQLEYIKLQQPLTSSLLALVDSATERNIFIAGLVEELNRVFLSEQQICQFLYEACISHWQLHSSSHEEVEEQWLRLKSQPSDNKDPRLGRFSKEVFIRHCRFEAQDKRICIWKR